MQYLRRHAASCSNEMVHESPAPATYYIVPQTAIIRESKESPQRHKSASEAAVVSTLLSMTRHTYVMLAAILPAVAQACPVC